MRVLHLISSSGMYGAEAVILQLSQALRSGQQHESKIGTFAHMGQPLPALHEAAVRGGLSSSLIACRGQLDHRVMSALRASIRDGAFDVVHAHGYKADIYAAAALLGRRRPVLVSTCHNWIDTDTAVRAYGALDRFVLRSFDEVIAVSRDVRARLVESGVPESRVHLIQNGVSIPQDQGAEKNGRPATALCIGLVGRLSREKGVDLFLRAAAQLARRCPELKFVVAGDGPERESLTALRDTLGLQDRLDLLGRQEDMAAFYRSLDLLVSSSRTEGLPMTLLEGMSWSLPIVATQVGEVPLVVEDGQTGLLVPPESPESLAHAMERLVRDAPERLRLAKAGRRRVEEHFSAARMAEEYLTVYARALRRRRAVSAVHRPLARPSA